MKKIGIVIFLFFIFYFNSCYAQGTWTWISGENKDTVDGVYGSLGVPSINNHPPGLNAPVYWKDKQGNFWIYGGSAVNAGYTWDMWRYNPATNEWTWMKHFAKNSFPAYGIKGVPAGTNSPGIREFEAAAWVDTSGMF